MGQVDLPNAGRGFRVTVSPEASPSTRKAAEALLSTLTSVPLIALPGSVETLVLASRPVPTDVVAVTVSSHPWAARPVTPPQA